MSRQSISERKAELFRMWEECVGCDGGMAAGDGGFTGEADAEGPVSGYDPKMGKISRIRKKRRNRIQPN